MQMSFLFPLFPKIVQGMGGGATEIGLLGSIAAIGEGVAAPYLGQLADRVGRKPVFIVSMIGCAISTVVTGFTTTLIPLCLARFINGVTGGTAAVACAYIADVTTNEERPRYMTYFQAALFCGLSFGPAIGGSLDSYFTSQGSENSYQTVCFAASGICVLNVIVVLFLLTESKSAEERQATNASAEGASMPCSVWFIFAANFIQGIGFTAFESLATIYCQDSFFADAPTIQDQINEAALFSSRVISGVGIVGLIVNLFVYNRVIPKTGLKGSIALGGSISAICFIGIAIPFSKWWYMAVVMIFIFGENIMGTSVQTIITVVVHPSMFGKAIGWMTFCGNFARALGPFIFGPIYDLNTGEIVVNHPDGETWFVLNWAHSIPWFTNAVFKVIVITLIMSVKTGAPPMMPSAGSDSEKQTQADTWQALQKTISRTTSTTYRTAGLGLVNLVSKPTDAAPWMGGSRRTQSLASSFGASLQQNLATDFKDVPRTQSVP